MSYNITSAATRGSVKLVSGPFPSPAGGEWTFTRDNAYLDIPSATVNSNDVTAIRAALTGSGGGYNARCNRYFMVFDTTSVPTQANSITLYVYCQTSVTSNFMVVRASAPGTGTNISGSNYKAIPGLLDGASMNTNATPYTAIPAVPGPSPSPSPMPVTPSLGWNAITLNSTAADDWNSGNTFAVALVNYEYDYLYFDPLPGEDAVTGISVGANAPYVVVETGIGQWVLSIDPNLTAKVNPVSEANVKLVNRVGAFSYYRTNVGSASSTPGSPVCDLTFSGTTPIYSAVSLPNINVGTIVYDDYALTTPFSGGSLYYGINGSIGGSWFGDVYQISNTGVVMAVSNCGW